jgi:hypothetical protein
MRSPLSVVVRGPAVKVDARPVVLELTSTGEADARPDHSEAFNRGTLTAVLVDIVTCTGVVVALVT